MRRPHGKSNMRLLAQLLFFVTLQPNHLVFIRLRRGLWTGMAHDQTTSPQSSAVTDGAQHDYKVVW